MNLKNLIKQKNTTMYKLSKETNIPYSTINDYCNNKKNLSKSSYQTLEKLADALNVSIEQLISDTQKRKEALKFASAVNAIEGTDTSDCSNFLMELWANGIISDIQLKQSLNLYHRRLSNYA